MDDCDILSIKDLTVVTNFKTKKKKKTTNLYIHL